MGNVLNKGIKGRCLKAGSQNMVESISMKASPTEYDDIMKNTRRTVLGM
jgi:hypothetical protein